MPRGSASVGKQDRGVVMPWYRIAYRPAVAGDLVKLEKHVAQRLLEKTKWLASNAETLRHEPLALDLPSMSKYAVGEWRIFYTVDRSEHLLDVHLIAHHKEIYRRVSRSTGPVP